MPDEFIEVKRTGYGQNIIKSILAIPFGMILFLASFVVLWTNEGRVNLGKVAEMASVVNAGTVEPAAEGKLVAVTGNIETATPIGDPEYLRPSYYVALYREVEMYAWVEEKETKTEKKTGGETIETITYRYEKKWTSDPKPSSEFKYPAEHANPAMAVQSAKFYARDARVGSYAFDPQAAGLPSSRPISLSTENVIVPSRGQVAANEYLVIGQGTLTGPAIGDLRISFEAVETGKQATLFGKQDGSSIAAYFHKGKTRLFRLESGTREEAIAELKTEHKITGWILRLLGFLLMWIGLSMFLAPISTVLDVLPFLGNIGRGLIGVVTFIIALVLSIVTIIVAMILHNVIALVIFIAAAVVIILVLTRGKKAPAGIV